MGTFKVNGDISATGTISASSFLGNASSATYTHQWRTTAENPCTTSTDSNTDIFNVPDSRIYWISKTGTVIDQLNQWGYILDIGNNAERHQIWMTQSSGDMAHRGGNSNGWSGSWRVLLDSINYTSYTVTKTGSGASGTWGINITGNATTSSSASLLSLHNNITNTSTRSTSASGWDGGVSGLQYVWGQSFKDTSIGADTGDLVLGLRAGQYTSGGTELCMMIDGDYYSMGNKVLHAGNYNSYAPTKTGSGASGTWGINITGSAAYATSASRLYSIDNSYKYGSANPYYGYLTYSAPYWDFKVSPATPADVRVSRAYTAGSADYATSAGNADRVYPINSNPNNSHPGYGLKVFYSWDQGQVGNDNGGYANGITIGSHPGDQAYGFQIVQNMWDDRTYTRRYDYGWQSWKTLAWTDDLAAYLPLSGGTMTGHLYATSGLSWNNSYWTPNGNIYCQPTGNGQEWSFDVGASGYTGCYWHVWSAKNGCSMLRCDADTNAVGIPNGPLYLGSSCYGPNLPGASYVGQIFFKT